MADLSVEVAGIRFPNTRRVGRSRATADRGADVLPLS